MGDGTMSQATARQRDADSGDDRPALTVVPSQRETPRGKPDWWNLISTVLIGAVVFTVAYANLMQWRSTGHPVGLGFVLQECTIGILTVIRRRPRGTSRSLIAWLATPIGTFAMMATPIGVALTGPAYDPVLGLGPVYTAIQIAGALCACYSLLWLGRSFGFVAANRGVRTGGPYRWVRHPAYASYLITHIGYVLENPSAFNLALVLITTTFQIVRIRSEESFLSADPEYVAYRARVQYRLVPFMY
jgi:protein-S-isoprenylcysteine O-methyltransferase Ste14